MTSGGQMGLSQQQQAQQQQQQQTQTQTQQTLSAGCSSQEIWERLEVLFSSIRNNARGGYEYPLASVVALETVLVRLYVEGPMRSGGSGM